MNLFKSKPLPTEAPAPALEPLSPLVMAENEMQDAARACNESSEKCRRLDSELVYWRRARESAFYAHSKNLDAHAAAKDRWLRLSNSAPVKVSGSVDLFPVGAVLESREN